ncbi:hypothetical protein [Micromonospora sp. LOL_023]|uniref:hypothetical protein n=1 Tax=Micromonospora sp. LOL_023 TaxID=3345418 RepID=UPI003A876670
MAAPAGPAGASPSPSQTGAVLLHELAGGTDIEMLGRLHAEQVLMLVHGPPSTGMTFHWWM